MSIRCRSFRRGLPPLRRSPRRRPCRHRLRRRRLPPSPRPRPPCRRIRNLLLPHRRSLRRTTLLWRHRPPRRRSLPPRSGRSQARGCQLRAARALSRRNLGRSRGRGQARRGRRARWRGAALPMHLSKAMRSARVESVRRRAPGLPPPALPGARPARRRGVGALPRACRLRPTFRSRSRRLLHRSTPRGEGQPPRTLPGVHATTRVGSMSVCRSSRCSPSRSSLSSV